MIDIKIDQSQIKVLSRMNAAFRKAAASALKSESNRLRGLARNYAASHSFGPYTGTTTALRYRYEYGRFISQLQRYAVDEEQLISLIGAISQYDAGKITQAKGQWVSKKAAGLALLHALPRSVTVTRAQQRAIAAKLNKRSRRYGGFDRWGGIGQFIPKIGTKTRKERGVTAHVVNSETQRSVRNMQMLISMKLAGYRWDKGWADQWGNA